MRAYMSKPMRRAILALAISAPGLLLLALASKMLGGSQWVVFAFICAGMCVLGLLLILADGIACAREEAEAGEREIEITYAGGGAWLS